VGARVRATEIESLVMGLILELRKQRAGEEKRRRARNCAAFASHGGAQVIN